MDHPRGAAARPSKPRGATGARADRDRHRAVLRHRPARPAGRDAGGQPALGLHQPARRRHRGRPARPRRASGDRHLPSPLLLLDGGVESGLRRPRLPPPGRPAVGDAFPPQHPLLVRGDAAALRRDHAGAMWRALPRGRRRPLARGRGRERGAAGRRRAPGGAGSALRQLHVQLPEPDPPPGPHRRAHRTNRHRLRLRPHLRRRVGPELRHL